MKTKNKILKQMLFSTVILFTAAVMFFSCRKETAATSCKDAMQEAASILGGEKLVGSITSESNSGQIMLDYQNGNQYFLIEKLPKDESLEVHAMSSAEIISSRYGLLIRDVIRNKMILLANNDLESKKKFEQIKCLFDSDNQSAIIFGTTIIKS